MPLSRRASDRIVPGFVDPHLHLLSASAQRLSIDVRELRTPAEMIDLLAGASVGRPRSEWLRVAGYDASRFSGAGIDRGLLDAVGAPNPIVVHELAGHQVVCNSEALRRLEAGEDRSGRVEMVDGVPTGRITDASELLARVPRLSRGDLKRALAQLSVDLAAAGVTAVTDATHTNGMEELQFLAEMKSEAIRQHVEVMVGFDALDAVAAAGLGFGSRVGDLTIGHLKLVPEAHPGASVADCVAHAVASGWPVAIHVLDVDALDVALKAIVASPAPPHTSHRLEHVALSLPEQVGQIARSGASVVTQPEFPIRRRHKYERELSAVERKWLYRVGSLHRAGVPVGASSDRPIIDGTPLGSFAAACGTADLPSAAPAGEIVDREAAMAMITTDAGRMGSVQRGSLGAGDRGDFVVLDRDPLEPSTSAPQVLATYVNGAPIFDAAQ